MTQYSNEQKNVDRGCLDRINTAPLKDKQLTNSSYLAVEIPLKLDHFMSNL